MSTPTYCPECPTPSGCRVAKTCAATRSASSAPSPTECPDCGYTDGEHRRLCLRSIVAGADARGGEAIETQADTALRVCRDYLPALEEHFKAQGGLPWRDVRLLLDVARILSATLAVESERDAELRARLAALTEVHEFYEFDAATEEQFDTWLHERIKEVRARLGLSVVTPPAQPAPGAPEISGHSVPRCTTTTTKE